MSSFISENIKILRKKRGLTQQQLADALKIRRAQIGSYEEGRADPKVETLIKMSDFFQVSLDHFITKNLKESSENEQETYFNARKLRVLAITVDNNDNEFINLVPQKAAAGYLQGFASPEYIDDLPKFLLPNFSDATYRAFEISGDSMLPIESGTFVFGKYVESWLDIRDKKSYIVVTKTEGIVFKRIENKLKNENCLKLHSDNPQYPPFTVQSEEVLEIWEAKAYLSTAFPTPQSEMNFPDIYAKFYRLEEELKKLQKIQ